MGKRVICLLIAAVMLVSFLGVRAEAAPVTSGRSVSTGTAGRVARSTSALVSAMLLVLAGVSIILLFDKK